MDDRIPKNRERKPLPILYSVPPDRDPKPDRLGALILVLLSLLVGGVLYALFL